MKLVTRYYWPFQVLECIGQVAYRLNFPLGSCVHPVLHLSLLKIKLRNKETTTIELLEVTLNSPPIQTQVVLAYRGKVNKAVFLIHWVGNNPVEATWKSLATTMLQSPKISLADKENLDKGRSVMEAKYERRHRRQL